MRRPELADVARAFGAPGAEPHRPTSEMSAVLLAAFEDADAGLCLLYTLRAAAMRRHAGEVSFPGGRVDASDRDPLAAALREAEEEVGLLPQDVRVLGHLTDFTTHYGHLVCAYVGEVVGEPPREARSKDEVARVLRVPVASLLDAARYESRRHVEMPADRRVHYWHLPEFTMWGITGELTARFLARVWGWAPPGEARVIDDVSGFRPARPPAPER